MIIRAPRPSSFFTQLRNDVLRDNRLTFKARGLLALMLSYPDNWRFSVEMLTKAGPDGRHAVTTGMAELEGAGFVVRQRYRNPDGTWASRLVVYDVAQPTAGPTVDKVGTNELSTSDNPSRITGDLLEHHSKNNDHGVTRELTRESASLCRKCKGTGRLVNHDATDVNPCHQCGGEGVVSRRPAQ
jgi:hypothetical protein